LINWGRDTPSAYAPGACSATARQLVRCTTGRGALLEERDREDGCDENAAKQREAIGVTHDRRLGSDCVAYRDDRAV